MAHRAPHDLPQHVAPPLVGGHHAVGDEERGGAGVVGDDPHRHIGRFHRAEVAAAGHLAQRAEQRREQVRVVVRHGALQDGGNPFQAHPGVDRRSGQRRQRSIRLAVEFHEDVVPDLDEPVARARRPQAHRLRAGQVIAAEIVNLRAAPAGPGFAHRPEVVRRPELRDALGRQVPPPELPGLIVARHAGLALEDRRVQPVDRELPDLGQQAPRQVDRLFLEVVAEGEVAEHLEERVMAQRGADVLEIVVLAADPHALLRAGRTPVVAPVLAEKHVLELVHSGVGEQQRRVVAGHQGGTPDDAVLVRLEELQEGTADVGRGHADYCISRDSSGRALTRRLNRARSRRRSRSPPARGP